VVRTRYAAVADVLAVLAFVAIGRRTHDEGNHFKDLLETLAPFLLGLVAGWTIVIASSRHAAAWRSGVVIWVTTVLVGMALRRWAFEHGTAFSFVVVATLFLGLFLVGWRFAVDRLAPWGRRRAAD
jgi:hypothetical protein